MAITTRDQVLAALAAGRRQSWQFMAKGSIATQAAGTWYSTFFDPGSPGVGTAPGGAWANCTSLAGTINFGNVSPAKRYLASLSATANQNGTLLVYDRLGSIGSIALTSTGNKTVSSAALPRSMGATDLNNVEAWVEVTTQTSTTAVVMSMNSYTNEAGTGTRAGATITFPATTTRQAYMQKLPLQAGDKGVKAISTVNVATAAAAGAATIMLVRPLALVPVIANVVTVFDIMPNLPRVYDGSSICTALLATSGGVFADVWGELVTVYDS